MKIITFERFLKFEPTTCYLNQEGEICTYQDSICCNWRVDSETDQAKITVILWDDYLDKEYSVEGEYDLADLTPEKCEEIYREKLKELYFTQDEIFYCLTEENFEEWEKQLDPHPTAEDFKEVFVREGLNEETWEYVSF